MVTDYSRVFEQVVEALANSRESQAEQAVEIARLVERAGKEVLNFWAEGRSGKPDHKQVEEIDLLVSEFYRAGLPKEDLVRTEEDQESGVPEIPDGNHVHLSDGVDNTAGLFRACEDRSSATSILTVDESGTPVIAVFAQPMIPKVYCRVGDDLWVNGKTIPIEAHTAAGSYALRRPRKSSAWTEREQRVLEYAQKVVREPEFRRRKADAMTAHDVLRV